MNSSALYLQLAGLGLFTQKVLDISQRNRRLVLLVIVHFLFSLSQYFVSEYLDGIQHP